MCCLFGFYHYGDNKLKNLSELTNSLAREATIRGTDATGIAYCDMGELIIHKEPKSAFDMKFKHPDSVTAVMGHTRHATQGKEIFNYNNHPFSGKCKNGRFVLAHNGVLSNDKELKIKFSLPKTKIETDSYIAVQLLKFKRKLNIKNLKFMAEQVKGSFAFTVLDENNILRFVRGDSPLSLFHFPDEKIYVYASTESILYKGLVDTDLFDNVITGNFEKISIKSGEILSIYTDGNITRDEFEYKAESYFDRLGWWDYGYYSRSYFDDIYASSSYLDDLKSVAKSLGYDDSDVDKLLKDGFTPEEIEDYLYCIE